MMMKYFLVPAVLVLATVSVCSGRGQAHEYIPELRAEIGNARFIMHNGSIELTCDSRKVRLFSNEGVVQLQLSRKLKGKDAKEETIATYSYQPSSPDNEPIVGEKYKDDPRWKIFGHGDGPIDNPTYYVLTALINETQCSDAGEYYCLVTYKDRKSGDQKKIKAHTVLSSITEVKDLVVNGTDSNGNDIFTSVAKKGESVTLNCYLKAPPNFDLYWRKDGEIITKKNTPELQEVERRGPYIAVALDGDCQQNQLQTKITVKAGGAIHYKCGWSYLDKSAAVNFHMDSDGKSWITNDPPVRRTSDVRAKLTDVSEIMANRSLKLTCDAKKVGLSSNAGVDRLELGRQRKSVNFGREIIASYVYKPSEPGETALSNTSSFRDDKRWTITGYGEGPADNPTSLYMTAVADKAKCYDSAEYYCLVSYMDEKSGYKNLREGYMFLPPIAEIAELNIQGKDSDGKDIFKNKISSGDVVTLDCYVEVWSSSRILYVLVWFLSNTITVKAQTKLMPDAVSLNPKEHGGGKNSSTRAQVLDLKILNTEST